MQAPQPPRNIQDLELDFRQAAPLRTLLGLFDVSPPAWLGMLALFTLKIAPVWLIPYMTGRIIDAATYPDQHARKEIWILTGILTAVILQNIFTHTGFAMLLSRAVRTMEQRVRGALVRRIQMLSISFHDDFAAGRLHSKMLRDVEALEGLANQAMNGVLQGLLVVVFALSITLASAPIVAGFYLLAVPASIGLVRVFGRSIRNKTSDFRTEVESMSANVSDMLEMIPVTRAHGLEDMEIARMDSQLSRVRSRGFTLDLVNSIFGSSTWVTFCLFQAGCLVFTALLAYDGKIRIGQVVMFQAYFGMIIGSVSMILNIFPSLMRGYEAIRSIAEILESPDIEQNQGKQPVGAVQGNLRFDQVCFAYPGTTRHAVTDITLDIRAGECVAFVGQSGSGKSTLMNLVIGFRRPDQGRILLDGTDLNTLDLRTFRQFIAVVPQQTVLFSGSIRDNIAYGIHDCPPEAINEAVRQANAHEFIAQLPEGLETRIGEHGCKLSGGQRQRLAIARALVRDPRIIILDEATSSLDTHSEKLVQDAIDQLVRNRTTLIVAHRLSTIRNAERIVVMKDGRIVETGTPDELLALQGEFHRLKSLQQ